MRLKVLGTFSKGGDSAVSLNFGLSGGRHCDRACRHHPDSTAMDATRACYAVRCEIRPDREELKAKLVRHETAGAADVIGGAIDELNKFADQVKWIRLSTNGSLPMPRYAGPRMLRALRQFLATARAHKIPVHIPVETIAKAQFYRRKLRQLVTIRLSAQSREEFLGASGAVSWTAGSRDQSRLERIESAKQDARDRQAISGRKSVVCPAVAASFYNRSGRTVSEVTCDRCKLCALADVDVVYPLH